MSQVSTFQGFLSTHFAVATIQIVEFEYWYKYRCIPSLVTPGNCKCLAENTIIMRVINFIGYLYALLFMILCLTIPAVAYLFVAIHGFFTFYYIFGIFFMVSNYRKVPNPFAKMLYSSTFDSTTHYRNQYYTMTMDVRRFFQFPIFF